MAECVAEWTARGWRTRAFSVAGIEYVSFNWAPVWSYRSPGLIGPCTGARVGWTL